MTLDPRTPVLIGSGQVLQHESDLAKVRDPAALMAEALVSAATDAGLTSLPDPDALWICALLSWNYGNPAAVVARHAHVSPRHFGLSGMGGNTPQSLVNKAANLMQSGDIDMVFIAGGETARSKRRAKQLGKEWNWATSKEPFEQVTDELVMVSPEEIDRKLYMPIQVYPIFESAIRSSLEHDITEHQQHLGKLWSRFSDVAAKNPNAWSRVPRTAEEIITPTADNRMIGFPYTKMMNSNNDVDMAAGFIMCTVEKATSLGVPRDRWVFVHSGTDAHEHLFISNRHRFNETPAVRIAGRRALELAGLGVDDVSIVDLYSCFPSAVQLGAKSLGLSLDRQLTRTGGLQFAGGPWNNYVSHAIATVMTDLRHAPGENGLVWGNGGFTTKHAFGVYSTRPPLDGFMYDYPQAEIDALPMTIAATRSEAIGAAVVEAYTVMHDREGQPEQVIASCLLADGRRAWGISTDPQLGSAMVNEEHIGKPCHLDADGVLRVA